MQVIPENLSTATGYHVFETPDDIIINSQIYDKITMEPKPYNFFNCTYKYHQYENLLLHYSSKLAPASMLSKEVLYNRYIIDNNDSSIIYFLNIYGNLCKIQKERQSYTITAISPDSGWRPNRYNYEWTNYKIIGQTNKYLIIVQTHQGDNGGGSNRYRMCSILRINKDTFAHDATCNVGTYIDYTVDFIKSTSNQIYFYGLFNGMIYIGLYNAETNSLSWIYSDTNQNEGTSIGIADIVVFRNGLYVLRGNQANKNFTLARIMINYSTNTCSLINNLFNPTNYFKYATPNSTCNLGWLHYSLYNIDDKYIGITSHDAETQQKYTDNYGNNRGNTYFSSQGLHRHVVLEYNQDTGYFAICAELRDLTTQRILGVLYPTPYHVFFLEDNAVVGYYFNEKSKSFSKVFEKIGNYFTMGLDSINNFYIFDNYNHCSIYNKNTSNELVATFEKETYDYEETNIETYIQIYAKNFLGQYIKTNVIITLTGNCKFKQNNSKELLFTTEKQVTTIPIVITDGGTVYCDIKEVN